MRAAPVPLRAAPKPHRGCVRTRTGQTRTNTGQTPTNAGCTRTLSVLTRTSSVLTRTNAGCTRRTDHPRRRTHHYRLRKHKRRPHPGIASCVISSGAKVHSAMSASPTPFFCAVCRWPDQAICTISPCVYSPCAACSSHQCRSYRQTPNTSRRRVLYITSQCNSCTRQTIPNTGKTWNPGPHFSRK